MTRLRDPQIRRLGAGLAGLALYLQLAFAGWSMLALAETGKPIFALSGHALCLTGARTEARPVAPADSIPVAPVHEHPAFCCLWHLLPGVAPEAAQTPLPVAYVGVTSIEGPNDPFYPGPPCGAAKARAPPPILA